MNRLAKKFTSFTNFIKLFKNWSKAIRCWYSKTGSNTLLKLRDETQYYVRPGTSDIQMIIELYIGKSYHKNLEKLNKNPVIIDIGANIGTFSVFISKFNNDKCDVLAYEPFPDNFKILNENIKVNNLKSVKTFCLAVGDSNKERYLNIDADNAMHSFFIESGDKISVQTTTLEDILIDNKLTTCDFLKLDCEGAEYEIILSSPETIFQKIKIVSIEYHSSEKFNHIHLKETLEKNGFTVNVSESETPGFGFIDAIRT